MILDQFINEKYGDKVECARALGVTPATVRHWLRQNPRGILKYAPEIVNRGTEPQALIASVMEHEEFLRV